MNADDYRIRPATVADAAVIAHHRVEMFRDMGLLGAGDAGALDAGAHAYLLTALGDGSYRGWLVESRGRIVAGGGVLVRPMLPRPERPQGGREVEVLNVYTAPQHRRRGLARRLMDAILDWCSTHEVSRVTLHASADGRPLYESLGFVQTNEMRLPRSPRFI